MATHDYVIDNQTTPAFRSDLNNALAAIATNNSSASAPSTTYAGMWWLDTTNSYLKIRDQNDANWIIVGEFDVANSRIELISNSLTAASAAGIDVYNSSGTKIIDLQVASEATAKAGTNNTELMTPLRTRQAAGIVPGVLMPYAGSSEPSGWLFCYGQSLSTSTYADLFAAVGYTYGGSGASFNVPDLRGRTIAGQDDMGGTSADRLTSPINGDTLGASGGAESHTLTAAEMAHIHGFGEWKGTNDDYRLIRTGVTWSGVGTYTMRGFNGEGGDDSVTDSTGDLTTTSVFLNGSDTPSAHNNMQPTIVLNYIIKT